MLLGARAPRPPEPKTTLLKCQVKSYETKSLRGVLSAGEGARAPSKAEPRFRKLNHYPLIERIDIPCSIKYFFRESLRTAPTDEEKLGHNRDNSR